MAKTKTEAQTKTMWKSYSLSMYFIDRLLGGVPKHADVIKAWLEARQPSEAAFSKIENPVPMDELEEGVIAEMDATTSEEDKVWCGFKHDTIGLYIDGYHIKSHLKNGANILQAFLGMKALKAKLADRLFVDTTRVYLGKKEVDGYWEHPVHIMTLQGPRSALKRTDYVEKVTISCTLKVLNDNVITEDILRNILDFGCEKGFGAERGLGNGKYTYRLSLIEDEK